MAMEFHKLAAELGGLVGLVAGTGGLDAVPQVLQGFPSDGPPVLVVQHTPIASFLPTWAKRVNAIVPPAVRIGVDGEPLQRGTVYIAPPGRHMRVNRKDWELRVELRDTPPLQGRRPAADVLLRSFAVHAGEYGCAAVLTGEGTDGAEGLAAMRMAGCQTLVQDKGSAAVHGMAAAVLRRESDTQTRPLHRIARALLKHRSIDLKATPAGPSPAWDADAMAVGIGVLDMQHKAIFDRFAEFRKAIAEGRDNEVGEIVYYLRKYADEHFDREEELMQRYDCPTARDNIAAHALFRRQLEQIQRLLGRGRSRNRVARYVEFYLQQWLVVHIAVIDAELGESARGN